MDRRLSGAITALSGTDIARGAESIIPISDVHDRCHRRVDVVGTQLLLCRHTHTTGAASGDEISLFGWNSIRPPSKEPLQGPGASIS